MKLIELTRDQCFEFSPLGMTWIDCIITSNLKLGSTNDYYSPMIIVHGDIADAMIMKIRTQLSGKPADKEAAVFTALRLQGFEVGDPR